jgi:hypothetical protein
MRMTKHAGHYNGNEHALQLSIRSQFKANMLETDEKKIAAMKSEYAFIAFISFIIYLIVILVYLLFLLCRAIRALSNYFVYQAKLYAALFFQSIISHLQHAAGSLTLHSTTRVSSAVWWARRLPSPSTKAMTMTKRRSIGPASCNRSLPLACLVPNLSLLSSFFILHSSSRFDVC